MDSFVIESYKTRLEIQRFGTSPTETRRSRIIELNSVAQFHGIVVRAVLNFSTVWDSWSGSPVVGFFNGTNPFQPVVAGWLPSSEFSLWYDVLRNESPLTFFFEVTDVNGAPYVTNLSIGTSVEPTGEGPQDLSP